MAGKRFYLLPSLWNDKGGVRMIFGLNICELSLIITEVIMVIFMILALFQDKIRIRFQRKDLKPPRPPKKAVQSTSRMPGVYENEPRI